MGVVIDSHGAGCATFHEHPGWAVTVTLPLAVPLFKDVPVAVKSPLVWKIVGCG
jgi:hypothetical protein